MKTLDLLETALLPTREPDVDPVIRASFVRRPRATSQELLPHLNGRGKELARGGTGRPGQAGGAGGHRDEDDPGGAKEAGRRNRRHSTEIRSSCSTSTTTSTASSNRTSGTGRSACYAIDHELATEPDRIRSIYEIKAQRIEPIGLVYLWPVSG